MLRHRCLSMAPRCWTGSHRLRRKNRGRTGNARRDSERAASSHGHKYMPPPLPRCPQAGGRERLDLAEMRLRTRRRRRAERASILQDPAPPSSRPDVARAAGTARRQRGPRCPCPTPSHACAPRESLAAPSLSSPAAARSVSTAQSAGWCPATACAPCARACPRARACAC